MFVGTQRDLFKLQPHRQCKFGSYLASIDRTRKLTHANTAAQASGPSTSNLEAAPVFFCASSGCCFVHLCGQQMGAQLLSFV